MKVRIYLKHSGLFYVLVEGNDGWYRTYNRSFANPNRVFHKLQRKKLSVKYITKLFTLTQYKYTEERLDNIIKEHNNITHVASYEIKK